MVERMDTGCWEQNRKPNDRWNQELREREGGRARERERVWKGRSDYIHEFSVVDLSGE